MKVDKITKTISGIFAVCFAIIIGYFVIGELVSKPEVVDESDKAIVLDAGWHEIMPDGKKVPVELPKKITTKNDKTVIEGRLPDKIEDNYWISILSDRQEVKIYVEGKLRKGFSTNRSRILGEISANAIIFTRLNHKDSGKDIRIEVFEKTKSPGHIYPVYYGEKNSLLFEYINEYGTNLVVAVVLAVFGIAAVMFSLVLAYCFKRRVDLIYLGWGMLVMAIWLFSESKLRQFYLPNISVAYDVSYFAAMLLPVPFMIYIDYAQQQRYNRAYKIAESIALAYFFTGVTVYISNISDVSIFLYITELEIVCSIIFVLVTFGVDWYRHKIKEYKWIVIGFVGVFSAATDELFRITFRTDGHGVIILGVTFLFLMAAINTSRELIEVEKERQKAVLANEAKAKFLANMSHEIRTPINSIIGMNEMTLRENKDENLSQYIRSVQNSSKMLLALVNDILDFSKIESGKLDLVEGNYDVEGFVYDITEGIKSWLVEKKLDFSVEVDDNIPAVLYGDEIRIKQICNNLLTNAIKYTNEGYVKFSIKAEEQDEEVVILSISVEDSGIGIREEDLPRLFDSFTRFEERINATIEGTGLGLSITSHLVNQMDGQIDVKSTYRKGSVFTVRIPQNIIDNTPVCKVHKSGWKVDKGTQSQQLLYAPDAKVLIVDDNKTNLAVAKALLKRTRLKVVTVTSGKECLEICRNERFDLIFMDHMMPIMDGIETLHELRKDKKSLNAETVVVVLTANAIANMKEYYLSQGFSDYITKPIEANCLEKVMLKYLPKEKIIKKTSEDNKEKSLQDNRENNFKENSNVVPEVSDVNEYEKMINYLVEKEDWPKLREVISDIKTDFSETKAAMLIKFAQHMEAAIDKGDKEYIKRNYDKFITLMKKTWN